MHPWPSQLYDLLKTFIHSLSRSTNTTLICVKKPAKVKHTNTATNPRRNTSRKSNAKTPTNLKVSSLTGRLECLHQPRPHPLVQCARLAPRIRSLLACRHLGSTVIIPIVSLANSRNRVLTSQETSKLHPCCSLHGSSHWEDT